MGYWLLVKLWNKCRRCGVSRSDHAEVSAVQGCENFDAKPLRQNNQTPIGTAKGKVGVLLHQVSCSEQVSSCHFQHFEEP
jgi:hypothetical protein